MMGISEYWALDPKDASNLKHLQISGAKVGNMLTDKQEFPYDWESGSIVYIIFLSAIFMGTVILEGVDTSIMAQVRKLSSWLLVINHW